MNRHRTHFDPVCQINLYHILFHCFNSGHPVSDLIVQYYNYFSFTFTKNMCDPKRKMRKFVHVKLVPG